MVGSVWRLNRYQHCPESQHFVYSPHLLDKYSIIREQICRCDRYNYTQHPPQCSRTVAMHSLLAMLCSSAGGVKFLLLWDRSTQSLTGWGQISTQRDFGGWYSTVSSSVCGLLCSGWAVWVLLICVPGLLPWPRPPGHRAAGLPWAWAGALCMYAGAAWLDRCCSAHFSARVSRQSNPCQSIWGSTKCT